MPSLPLTRFVFAARVLRLSVTGLLALAPLCRGLTLYDFGNPIAEEQQYIELINRARADPPAEGARLAITSDPYILAAFSAYSVDLAMMQAEFNLISAMPPLAPNVSLTTAARGHSEWMLATATQSHDESATSSIGSRVVAAGYDMHGAGENLYAWAESVVHGHTGLAIDWGPDGTGGMQPGRGHRLNLLGASLASAAYREIGVGVVFGKNGAVNPVGPQLVTQDLAISHPLLNGEYSLATGVAYYDLNSNNFFDPGEEIAGLTVNVSGSGVTKYCTTAAGGGWVVPIPTAAATRTVSFTGLSMNQTASLVVPANQNAKADLQLTYTPPVFTSPTTAYAGMSHTVAFAAVGGASAYQWSRWTAAAAAETCESTDNITASTISGGYPVLNTSPLMTQQGTASFHLASIGVGIIPAEDQSIQLNGLYYGESTPTLTFQSKMRIASSLNQLKIQVKEEGSAAWQDVYSQIGTGFSGPLGYGEEEFTLRSAPLTSMVGKLFRVRVLLAASGSHHDYYPDFSDYFGWFIDDIRFSGVAGLSNNVTETLSGNSGSFTPSASTSYLMSVTPVISGHNYAPAVQTVVAAAARTPASVTLGNLAETTYTGSSKSASATTEPAGLAVTLTYNGSTTAPTAAGSYAVVGTINDPGYQGSASGTLVIAKAAATVTLGSLTATYSGSATGASATTSPADLTVDLTYGGSATVPTAAGTYAVVATINDTNYQGGASGNLVIAKATATATLGSLAATYNGSAKSATAVTSPVGLAVSLTYDGSATAPTAAGTYAVVATINDANYQGCAGGNLVIAKAAATVSLGSLAVTYNGSAKSATATTSPSGLAVGFTYGGSATAPTVVGSYPVVATITDPNYQGSAGGNLVISKATANAIVGGLAATYDGTAKSATVTTTPAGLTASFTYAGSATAPTAVGSYAVVATINDANYTGSGTGTLVISKGTATITLGSLAATYNGSSKPATATSSPVGLAVTITYNSSATAPTAAGSYTVVATINTASYVGTTTGTLVIAKAAATVTLGSLAATYNGSAKSATATTSPASLAVNFTYDGSATAPSAAGTYPVVATINNTNYQGCTGGNLVIAKAAATVALGSLAATYNGSAKSATYTTSPGGLAVTITYDGSATAPTTAGTYPVVATISNANYQGGTTGSLVIAKAAATVTLDGLAVTFDGSAKSATAITVPAGLAVSFTYAGAATAPTTAGSYAVVATISEANYQGSAAGVLVIGAEPTTFARSIADLEAANGLAAGTIANHPNDDYDHDGTSNLLEYAFGSSPVTSDTASRMPVPVANPTKLVMQYQRDTAITDLTFTPQACSTLGTWKDPGDAGAPSGFTDVLISTSGTVQTRQASVPRSSGKRAFMRMQVSQINDATPGTFAAWAANLESANGLAAGTLADHPNDDYDHDGRCNLLEYAFGSSPVTNDAATRVPAPVADPTKLVLQYQRDTALTDLTFTPQACSTLGSWKVPGESDAPSGFIDEVVSTSGTVQTRQASVPRSSGTKVFIRLQVTQP